MTTAYGFSQQLITWYTKRPLTAEGANARVVGPEEYTLNWYQYIVIQSKMYVIGMCAEAEQDWVRRQ